MAAAYAAADRFDKAIGWQEKAVELATDDQKEFESEVLQRYKEEQPYPTMELGDARP